MAAIDDLIKQIQSRSNTSQWSGGYGADAATKDMARILSSIGITNIKDFGKIDKYEPVEQIGMTLNGQPVQGSGSQLYVLESVDTGDGTDYVRRDLSPEQVAQVKPVYGVPTGYDENTQPTYRTVEATNVAVKDGQLVGVTGQTFGNKLTGQEVPNTYTTRQTGDYFGGTYEGKGNTGYGVQFDAQGLPVFYTQGYSSKDELIKPLTTMALMALGAYGLEGLLGAGAAGAAGAAGGAGGAGLATTGQLGSLAGTAGGTGLSAGATGFGTIKAGGTALGSIGTGAGLTGTGVLTGSSLGTGLLGGAGAAGLTGTGVLSASELGKALLGTTSTTPLVGSGVLTGSQLGSQLLGTGANTAATVGGLTGLTNAANVGYGALNTGVSTGLTGLGSGAVDTGINPSGATTGVIEPTVTTTPTAATTAAKTGLGASDIIRAAGVAATIAGLNQAVGGGGGSGGFPIVPIPSDWTSPIKPTGTAAFTPLAPIDFGNKEMLRGTQWEQLLSPDYGKAPAMPTSTNPSNMTFNELTKILGGSTTSAPSQNLSINDVIAGIQSQYGQTPQVPMG
jgi:hypothetical protein